MKNVSSAGADATVCLAFVDTNLTQMTLHLPQLRGDLLLFPEILLYFTKTLQRIGVTKRDAIFYLGTE